MYTRTRLEKLEQQYRYEIEKMKLNLRRQMIMSRLVMETELGWKAYFLSFVYAAAAAEMDLADYVLKMQEWGDGVCPDWQFIRYQTIGRDRAMAEMRSSGELAELQALFREFDANDSRDTGEALTLLDQNTRVEEQRLIAVCLGSKK